MNNKLDLLSNVYNKIKACIKPDTFRKIIPDTELLLEAEGFALRPGPKLNINNDVLQKLKDAILSCKEVEITYQTPSNNLSTQLVDPYVFYIETSIILLLFLIIAKLIVIILCTKLVM